MPSIREQSTVEAIAQAFTGSEKRNKVRAMMAVGYTEAYANSGRGQKIVYENVRVREAIKAIDSQVQAKYDHNREIAIDKLCADYQTLQARADNGDIQAIQARTAIVRELNACTGLHSSTLHTPEAQPVPLTDAETEELKAMAEHATRLRRQETQSDDKPN